MCFSCQLFPLKSAFLDLLVSEISQCNISAFWEVQEAEVRELKDIKINRKELD